MDTNLLESDRLGLADGLQFADLSFTGNKIMVGEELFSQSRWS